MSASYGAVAGKKRSNEGETSTLSIDMTVDGLANWEKKLSRRKGACRGIALTVCGLVICAGNVYAQPGRNAFDCLIEPAQTIELASPVTGLVDHVLVKRGDRFRKGQILATLESQAEQAAANLALFKAKQTGPLRTAENKVVFAKRKFERKSRLASENLAAAQDRDDAEAELRLAQSELQVADENRQAASLEYKQQSAMLVLRTLRSPFNGVVTEQLAFPGEVVEPGSGKKAVFKLAELDPLRVHVVLPKEVFGKLAIGGSVDVSPEIPVGSHYRAKISSIDRLIDAASGTFVAILVLPNPKQDIPAGVKCKADFAVLGMPK